MGGHSVVYWIYDDLSPDHYFAMVFLHGPKKNVLEIFDILDIVWFKINTKKHYRYVTNVYSDNITRKITRIEIGDFKVDKFLPIEKSDKIVQQMILNNMGKVMINKSHMYKCELTSCISYLWNKSIITLPIYECLCSHNVYGEEFRKNEFQINPLIRFVKFGIPISMDNIPCLDFYLSNRIISVNDITDLIAKSNIIESINILSRAVVIQKCQEVALIAYLTQFLPEELYPILLFYMI